MLFVDSLSVTDVFGLMLFECYLNVIYVIRCIGECHECLAITTKIDVIP